MSERVGSETLSIYKSSLFLFALDAARRANSDSADLRARCNLELPKLPANRSSVIVEAAFSYGAAVDTVE